MERYAFDLFNTNIFNKNSPLNFKKTRFYMCIFEYLRQGDEFFGMSSMEWVKNILEMVAYIRVKEIERTFSIFSQLIPYLKSPKFLQ